MKEQVLEYLKKNKDVKKSGNHLRNMFNLSTIKLQKIIHDLREDGEPIAAYGNNGYSYTNNRADVLNSYLSLIRRAEKMVRAADGMKRWLDDTFDIHGEHIITELNEYGASGYVKND